MIEIINDKKKQNFYLVTTAIEEFWDVSSPIVFLGDWCLRYSRRLFWEPLNGEILDYPWNDRKRFIDAFFYIEGLYERMLGILKNMLNRFHKVDHDLLFWRIIIGPWLRWYITVIYDRYTCIQDAIKKYPGFTTKVLSTDNYKIPVDTFEFIQYVKNDTYNLQIFSVILKNLGYKFPEVKYYEKTSEHNDVIKQKMPKKILRRAISRFLRFAGQLCCENNSIILKNPYFSFNAQLRFFIKTMGKVRPTIDDDYDLESVDADSSKRSIFKNMTDATNSFEEILFDMMPFDIPRAFVELFDKFGEKAKNRYPQSPVAIVSSDSWYYDEVFKQWAATAKEKGTFLIGIQHGGNYGSLDYIASDHEILITDRFYSWGWVHRDYPGKVVPMSSPKLSGRKKMSADNKKEGILYATTSIPRYLFQFPFLPNRFKEYLEWQKRFFYAISPDNASKIRIRAHREDFGWDIAMRLLNTFNEVVIEEWDIPFSHSIENCRIFVSDSLTTTFLESLSVKKPTILFWNKELNELRPEAQSYYDQLSEAGILFDSPEGAAHAIDVAYNDVENWWNEPQRQKALSIFCNRFAMTSDNFITEWTDEFLKILDKPSQRFIN